MSRPWSSYLELAAESDPEVASAFAWRGAAVHQHRHTSDSPSAHACGARLVVIALHGRPANPIGGKVQREMAARRDVGTRATVIASFRCRVKAWSDKVCKRPCDRTQRLVNRTRFPREVHRAEVADARAQRLVDRILRIAPVIPVQYTPPARAATVSRNRGSVANDICPASTPHTWNIDGVCVSTYAPVGSLAANDFANSTSARAAAALSVVAGRREWPSAGTGTPPRPRARRTRRPPRPTAGTADHPRHAESAKDRDRRIGHHGVPDIGTVVVAAGVKKQRDAE